jgi:hypothetical protein
MKLLSRKAQYVIEYSYCSVKTTIERRRCFRNNEIINTVFHVCIAHTRKRWSPTNLPAVELQPLWRAHL